MSTYPPLSLPVGFLPEFDFERVPSAPVALVAAAARAECDVSVAVPVHNEEAGIAGTLAALASQTDLQGRPLDLAGYEVLVLANNCADGTAARVRRFAAAHPAFRLHLIELTLPPTAAHVGGARRAVMDEAWRRLHGLGRKRGIVATTDGDTVVHRTWIAATRAEFAAGADAVGGRILAGPGEIAGLDEGTRFYYRQDAIYHTLREAYESLLDPDPANPWPRHQHCYGGSLAVTAQAYRDAGGMPAVPHLEDLAFCDRLHRQGARVRRSGRVKVYTSLRRAGRVSAGLSCRLSWWGESARTGQPYLVESAAAIERAARGRQRLRRFWGGGRTAASLAELAAGLEIEAAWLGEHCQRAASCFEVFEAVRRRRADEAGGAAMVPVQAAVADLRERIGPHRARLCGRRQTRERGTANFAPSVLSLGTGSFLGP